MNLFTIELGAELLFTSFFSDFDRFVSSDCSKSWMLTPDFTIEGCLLRFLKAVELSGLKLDFGRFISGNSSSTEIE